MPHAMIVDQRGRRFCNDSYWVDMVPKALDPADVIAVACNFTPVPRYDYRIGVPTGGPWREIFNTDSSLYAGGNIGNGGTVWALDEPWAGQPHSLKLTLPPLAGVYLTPGA